MGSFLLWTPGYYNKRDSTIASLPVKVYVSQKKSEETSTGQIEDINKRLESMELLCRSILPNKRIVLMNRTLMTSLRKSKHIRDCLLLNTAIR